MQHLYNRNKCTDKTEKYILEHHHMILGFFQLPQINKFSKLSFRLEPSLFNESVKRHFCFFFYATAIEDQNLTKRSYKRYFFCFFLYSVAIEDQNLTSLKKEATRGVFLVFSLHSCIWWSKFDNPQKKLLEVPLLRFSLHSFIWGSKFDNPKKNNLLEVSFLFFLN